MIVALDNITKTYVTGEVEVPVLRGLDLQIDAGEYVAIMGRSGSGKSTLMNILGLLDRPTSGSYALNGVDIATLDDDRLSSLRGRTIGFVFQSFHLLGHLTITENVQLPMTYQGTDETVANERAKRLLDRVGLSHRLAHTPSSLSGGERQRVAIARALANEPQVLLADEPTGNLDSAARNAILDLFEELRTETGITLIMVTHDDEIGELAERRIVVSDGKVTG